MKERAALTFILRKILAAAELLDGKSFWKTEKSMDNYVNCLILSTRSSLQKYHDDFHVQSGN